MAQQIAMQIGPEDSERRAWINKSGHGQRIKIARACRQSTPAVQHGRDRSGSRACLLPGLTSRVTQGGKQAREKRSMHPAGCHSAPARPCAWQGRWEGFLRRPPQAEKRHRSPRRGSGRKRPLSWQPNLRGVESTYGPCRRQPPTRGTCSDGFLGPPALRPAVAIRRAPAPEIMSPNGRELEYRRIATQRAHFRPP